MRICVDFDGTIVEEVRFPQKPNLIPGAKEAIDNLKKNGHYIIIFSARNNPEIREYENRFKAMQNLLEEYEISYDEIYISPKPICDLFVDDRSLSSLKSVKDFLNGKFEK